MIYINFYLNYFNLMIVRFLIQILMNVRSVYMIVNEGSFASMLLEHSSEFKSRKKFSNKK